MRFGVTSAKLTVYSNWALEAESTMFGAVAARRSPGYVKQEKQRKNR